MGKFSVVGKAARNGLNPTMRSILEKAARNSPYDVEAYSGYRPGDRRYHGRNQAVDVRLVDPRTGKAIPNYQSAEAFRAYEQFAQQAKMVQQQIAPEEAGMRWGGYFSGAPGVYGAADLMHFDFDPKSIGMAGGSWATGLTPEQEALYPGAVSLGLGPLGAMGSVPLRKGLGSKVWPDHIFDARKALRESVISGFDFPFEHEREAARYKQNS